MQIRACLPSEMSPELWLKWDAIQQANANLRSPYFTAEFTRLVGSVRDDTEIGVLYDNGSAVGFLPYHRRFLGIAEPLAGHLSDFQTVVASPDLTYNIEDILHGCRLSGWDFDHALASGGAFTRYVNRVAESPYIDLSNGFAGYEQNRKACGSKVLKNLTALGRKLEREIGPIRFEYNSIDTTVFERMLEWKTDQYDKTGVANVFAHNWTVDLLKKIWKSQTPSLAGTLSGIWVGARLIAVHMGMRSQTVWHYWFPTYDAEFHRYSPGLLLLLEMMKAAESHGLTRIDLGKGDAEYKSRLMTGAMPVLEGSVMVSAPVRWARQSWRNTVACLRRAVRYPARFLVSLIRNRNLSGL